MLLISGTICGSLKSLFNLGPKTHESFPFMPPVRNKIIYVAALSLNINIFFSQKHSTFEKDLQG